ncbi:MAG TPA: TlpA family protein disulfide reductase [Gammaproteobacteria bacterium]|nr:TlpA family protein disulfide reductase [Gammaproteobacteria bacterium]
MSEKITPLKRPGLVLGLLTVGVATVVGYFVFSDWAQRRAAAERGEVSAALERQRPGFGLPDMDGVVHHIDEWDGKVIALNFWATWCRPCLREIPMLNGLQARYGEQGLQVIGVALDDREAVSAFIRNTPIDYAIMIGEDDAVDVARAYGNDAGVLPYTAIIDRDGRIAAVEFGELHEREAITLIQPLL